MWVLIPGGGALNLQHCFKLTVGGQPEASEVTAWPTPAVTPAVVVHKGSRDSCDSFIQEVTARMNAGWIR